MLSCKIQFIQLPSIYIYIYAHFQYNFSNIYSYGYKGSDMGMKMNGWWTPRPGGSSVTTVKYQWLFEHCPHIICPFRVIFLHPFRNISVHALDLWNWPRKILTVEVPIMSRHSAAIKSHHLWEDAMQIRHNAVSQIQFYTILLISKLLWWHCFSIVVIASQL